MIKLLRLKNKWYTIFCPFYFLNISQTIMEITNGFLQHCLRWLWGRTDLLFLQKMHFGLFFLHNKKKKPFTVKVVGNFCIFHPFVFCTRLLWQWSSWAARNIPQKMALMRSSRSTAAATTPPPTAKGPSFSLTSREKTSKKLLTGENGGEFFVCLFLGCNGLYRDFFWAMCWLTDKH